MFRLSLFVFGQRAPIYRNTYPGCFSAPAQGSWGFKAPIHTDFGRPIMLTRIVNVITTGAYRDDLVLMSP